MTSALIVPLTVGGRTFGTLTLGLETAERHFSPEDVALAESCAALVALASSQGERRKRERELEARYRGVVEGVLDAVLIVDAAGRYVDANAAAEELFGYDRSELLRLRVGDLPVAGPSWTPEERARFVREGSWRGIMAVRRKDGRLIRVDVRVSAMVLPNDSIYLTTLRPIEATPPPAHGDRAVARHEAGSA